MRFWKSVALAVLVAPLTLGCRKPKQYSTTMEILQIRRFGQDPKGGTTELELKFTDCPADARKVVRGDKTFGACAASFQRGDKLPAEIVLNYSSERGSYRNELVRLGDCPVKLDPKDDANYEIVQECRDLVATGAVVGVHCDRQRSPALLEKCPWLRRK